MRPSLELRNKGLLSLRVMPPKAQAACQPPAESRRTVQGWRAACALSHDSKRQQARAVATLATSHCSVALSPSRGHQPKARRHRSALGRARRALAPRPALRATVARRLRSSRARPAATRRPPREQPQQRRSVSPAVRPVRGAGCCAEPGAHASRFYGARPRPRPRTDRHEGAGVRSARWEVHDGGSGDAGAVLEPGVESV